MRLRYHCAPILDRTKVMVQQSQIERGVTVRGPGEIDIRCSGEINALYVVSILLTSSNSLEAKDAPLSPSPGDSQMYQSAQGRRRHGGTRSRSRFVPIVCHLHCRSSGHRSQVCQGISCRMEIASSLVRDYRCGHPIAPSSREGVLLSGFGSGSSLLLPGGMAGIVQCV